MAWWRLGQCWGRRGEASRLNSRCCGRSRTSHDPRWTPADKHTGWHGDAGDARSLAVGGLTLPSGGVGESDAHERVFSLSEIQLTVGTSLPRLAATRAMRRALRNHERLSLGTRGGLHAAIASAKQSF